MLKWLKREFQKHIAQDVPNALARCEFGCRVGQCSRGEWEQCEKRISLAKQLEEQASGMITPAAWPPGSSSNKLLDQTRSTLTTLHRSRSRGTHKTKPGGQAESERNSATVCEFDRNAAFNLHRHLCGASAETCSQLVHCRGSVSHVVLKGAILREA